MRPRWLPLVLIILFTVWLRARHLVTFIEWPDEIWSVWHVRGSLTDVLARTASDWPPLFGIITWAWQQFVGTSLEAARWMMVLFAALGTAFYARAGTALALMMGRPARAARYAGYGAALAFASMGYMVFTGVDVRAYGMLMAAGGLAFWLILRWLRNPNVRRSALLALTLAWLFYSSYTSLIYIAFLTLFVLVMRPRLFLRWVGVGVATVALTLPTLVAFVQNSGDRFVIAAQIPPPFAEAMLRVWSEFGGSAWFLLLLGGAALLVLTRVRHHPRITLLLFLWASVPAAAYVVLYHDWFLKPRYLWWVGLGLGFVIAAAVSWLAVPRARSWLALSLTSLILLPVVPVDFFDYRMYETSSPPFRHVLGWLADHMRPDDVLVIDPACTCGVDIAWDYFVPQFFPTGDLGITDEPGDADRVWYLSTTGWPRDEALLASIEHDRTPTIFAGPWYFLVQLYERPPLEQGIRFGEHIRLHGVEVEGLRTTVGESDTLTVRLWWSTDERLDVDYSFALYLLDERGNITVQNDGPPRMPNTPEATSAWEPGTFYEDIRQITIPPGIGLKDAGPHRLVLTVYQWWDGVRLEPESNDYYPVKESNVIELEQIELVAF